VFQYEWDRRAESDFVTLHSRQGIEKWEEARSLGVFNTRAEAKNERDDWTTFADVANQLPTSKLLTYKKI
jgi:hypothetical protein